MTISPRNVAGMLCPGEHVTWPLLCPLTCRVGFLLHSYTCTSSSPGGHSRVSGSYVPCILSSFRDSLENNIPGRPQVQRPGIALGFSNTRGALSLLNIQLWISPATPTEDQATVDKVWNRSGIPKRTYSLPSRLWELIHQKSHQKAMDPESQEKRSPSLSL